MLYEAAHPAFPVPPKAEVSLWRYLDSFKFRWLATKKRLYMPAAANLGDPLEGTQPSGHDAWLQASAKAANSDQERETNEHNRQLISRFAAAFRDGYYVSCWHMNEVENPYMWSRYTIGTEAVAVKTTYSRLREVLQPYVRIGMVRYIDYSKERLPTLNMFEYITHKHEDFALEAELRAVALHPVIEGQDQQHFREHLIPTDKDPKVLAYAPTVNLQKLVTAVVLHPDAALSFQAEVKQLCKAAGLPAPTKKISLRGKA